MTIPSEVEFRKCPACGYIESQILIDYVRYDFYCARCKTNKLSDYVPVTKQKTQDEWTDLDAAAIANLSGYDLDDFFRYRDCLKAEGHVWDDDAEIILSGYIWNASE